MSNESAKPAESKDATPADAEKAAAAPKKPSAIGGVLKILFPALLAAGAAYGGTMRGAAAHPAAGGHEEAAHEEKHAEPPGPTLPLDAFLITVYDEKKKAHPMKMSLAIEFDAKTHGELKDFTPRIRDGVITYLRTMSYEQVTGDPTTVDKIRVDLLEKCKASGATTATRVLVTDFVIQ